MRFHPTKAKRFSIEVADSSAAKEGEKPGSRAGELVFEATCVDGDGDEKGIVFYVSDALNKSEIKSLSSLLDKVSSHAIDELTD